MVQLSPERMLAVLKFARSLNDAQRSNQDYLRTLPATFHTLVGADHSWVWRVHGGAAELRNIVRRIEQARRCHRRKWSNERCVLHSSSRCSDENPIIPFQSPTLPWGILRSDSRSIPSVRIPSCGARASKSRITATGVSQGGTPRFSRDASTRFCPEQSKSPRGGAKPHNRARIRPQNRRLTSAAL